MSRMFKNFIALLMVFTLLWSSFPVAALAEAAAEPAAVAEAAPETLSEAPAPETETETEVVTEEPAPEPPAPEPEPEEPAKEDETTTTDGTAVTQDVPEAEETPASQGDTPLQTDTPENSVSPEPSVSPETTLTSEPSVTPEITLAPEATPIPTLEGFEIAFEENGVVIDRYTGSDASVTVPAFAGDWPVVRIATGAFANNAGITSVTIADGVQAVATGAFDGCENLLQIKMPSSLTSIAQDAVINCPVAEVVATEGTIAADFAAAYAQAQLKPALDVNALGDFQDEIFNNEFATEERHPDGWFAADSAYSRDNALYVRYSVVDFTRFDLSVTKLQAALDCTSTNGLNARAVAEKMDGVLQICIYIQPENSGSASFTLKVAGFEHTETVEVAQYNGNLPNLSGLLAFNPNTMSQESGVWTAHTAANVATSVSGFFAVGDNDALDSWNWYLSDGSQLGKGSRWHTFPQGENTYTVTCEYGANLRLTSNSFSVVGASGFDDYIQTQLFISTSENWYYVPGQTFKTTYCRYSVADWLQVDESDIHYTVSGGDGVMEPSLLHDATTAYLILRPVGLGTASVTVNVYIKDSISLSQTIELTVTQPAGTNATSMSLSQNEIIAQPNVEFTWPTAVFDPIDATTATWHHWIQERTRDITVEIVHEGQPDDTTYTLTEPGVYNYTLIYGDGLGVRYYADFTVYCGVQKPDPSVTFDDMFTSRDEDTHSWFYAPGCTTSSIYETLIPKTNDYSTITYETVDAPDDMIHTWVNSQSDGSAEIYLVPQAAGTAHFRVIATVDDVAYVKDYALEIAPYDTANMPVALLMNTKTVIAHAGVAFDIPDFTPVPASADKTNLPTGHRVFEVLNATNLSHFYESSAPLTTFTFDDPGVYYCRVNYAIGHSVNVPSDVFTVFVDEVDTVFNRAFSIDRADGHGMPTALYYGDGTEDFTCSLYYNEGIGINGFQVNNISSSNEDVLSIGWERRGDWVLLTMKTHGVGTATVNIGLQDSNGINYSQDFNVDVLAVPEGWALPSFAINGLNESGWQVVSVNDPSFSVDYTIEGTDASLFAKNAYLDMLSQQGNENINYLSTKTFYIKKPGLYPVQMVAYYRNVSIRKSFYIAVKDEMDNLPTADINTYFDFYWNPKGFDGGLYFAPQKAAEAKIGEIQMLEGCPFAAEDVQYEVSFLGEVGENQCATVTQSQPEGTQADSILYAKPNSVGAAGISTYRMTITVNQGDGNPPLTYTEDFSVNMQSAPANLPDSQLTLTKDVIMLDYHAPLDGEENYMYELTWPGISLPEGQAFPEGTVVSLYHVENDGQRYSWGDDFYDAVLTGQESNGVCFADHARAYTMLYQVRYGNIVWEKTFKLCIGVTENDVSLLFDIGTQTRTIYFDQGTSDGIWLGNLYSKLHRDVTAHGATFISGDDSEMGLETFTDQDYEKNPHEFTDVGLTINPTRTGTSVVRLWATVNQITYSHDFTVVVLPLPQGLPDDYTLNCGDTLTVKAGVHFGIPVITSDLSAVTSDWYQRISIENQDGLLQNNDEWGDHEASDKTEYWVDVPGRYKLVFDLMFGENYHIQKYITLLVQNSEGVVPVTTVTLQSNQWLTWVPCMPKTFGDYIYDMGNGYIDGLQLAQSDREVWSYEINAQSVGSIKQIRMNPQESAKDGGSSVANIQGLFPIQTGVFTLRLIYDAYDALNNHIYHGEGEDMSLEVLASYEDYHIDFDPNAVTEYTANESGFVHIAALGTSIEGWDVTRGAIGSNYWVESGPSMEDAQLTILGDVFSGEGCNVRLNPDRPGIYTIVQDAWVKTLGVNAYNQARIRVIVGDPENSVITLGLGDTYPATVALNNPENMTIYNNFWVEGAALGDTLTWTVARTAGDSLDVVLDSEHSARTKTVTRVVEAEEGTPYCLITFVDINKTGESQFLLTLKDVTTGGHVYEKTFPFTVNVVDDNADGFLPVLSAAQTTYTLLVGQTLTLEQPSITLPAGVTEDDLFRIWRTDDELIHSTEFINGKACMNICGLTPGYYTARFTALRSRAPVTLDYQIIVKQNDDTTPETAPQLKLTNGLGKDTENLSCTVDAAPDWWKYIGEVHLVGQPVSDTDVISFAASKEIGENCDVLLKPITRTAYFVFARYMDINQPNEIFAITAKLNDADIASTTFTLKAPSYVESITVENTGAQTLCGLGTTKLVAVVSPVTATNTAVTWSLPSNAPISIDQDGNVTAHDVDVTTTVTVTATAEDENHATGTYELTVMPRIKQISLQGNASMYGGTTQQLSIAITPAAAAKTVLWTSSNEGAATVDENGLVSAVDITQTATTVIRATANDGSRDGSGNLVIGSFNLTVVPLVRVSNITLTAATTSLAGTSKLQLGVTVEPANATDSSLTWMSSDSDIATVSNSGYVVVKDVDSATTVTITATAADIGGVTGEITLSIVPRIKTLTIAGDSSVLKERSLQLTAVTTPDDALDTALWSSSNTRAATVDTNGLVTAKVVTVDTPVTITATAHDVTGNSSAPVVKGTKVITVKAMVNISKIVVSAASSEVIGRSTLQMSTAITPTNASIKVPVWSSSNTAAATVDENGLVTAQDVDAVTNVTITATANDDAKVKGTKVITVVPRIKSLSITGASHDMLQGTTQTLTATVSPTGAKQLVTWTSANTNIATVDASGKVGILSYDDVNPTVTITATANDGSTNPDGTTVTGTFIITVCPKVTDIAIVAKDAGNTESSSIYLDNPVDAYHTLTLYATVTPSDASRDLTWTVADPSIITLDANHDGSPDLDQYGNVVATGLLPGTTSITATAKDGSLVKGTVSGLTVIKEPTSLGDDGTLTLSPGMTYQIDASGIASKYLAGNRITQYSVTYDSWTAGDKKLVVSTTGLISVTAQVINAVITLKTANPLVFAQIAVSVTGAPTKLELSGEAYDFGELGSTKDITVTATDKDNAVVPISLSATSANPAIASVEKVSSNRFTVTAMGLGSTTITIKSSNGLSATFTANINKMLTGIALSAPETMFAGKGGSVKVTFTPMDASDKGLTWSTALKDPIGDAGFDMSLVQLKNGLLTVSPSLNRVVDIVVTATPNASGVAAASCEVRLIPLVSKVVVSEVEPKSTTLIGAQNVVDFAEYSTVQLAAELEPASVGNYVAVQWTSSVPTVATVDAAGIVSLLKPGTTTITATALDVNKKAGSFVLAVKNLVSKITVKDALGATSGTLIGGLALSQKLTATCEPVNATSKAVDWSVRYEPVDAGSSFVDVSAAGVVTVNSTWASETSRDVTIVATAKDGSGVTGEYALTVYPRVTKVDIATLGAYDPSKAVTLDISDVADTNGMLPLAASVLPDEASQALVWKTSNTQVATIVRVGDNTYLKLLKPTTSVTLTATATDGSGAYDNVKLTVTSLPQEVTIAGASGVATKNYAQYTASVLPATATVRTVRWTLRNQASADFVTTTLNLSTISSTGKLTVGEHEEGTLIVRATCTTNPLAYAEYEVDITPIAASVSVSIMGDSSGETSKTLELSDVLNNTLQLTATVTKKADDPTSLDPSQFVYWTTSNASVAKVATVTQDDTQYGLVTAVAPGNATITSMAADGSRKTGTFKITVTCQPTSVTVAGVSTLLAGKSTALKATVAPAAASVKTVTWSLCDENGDPLTTLPAEASLNSITGVLQARVTAATAPTTVYVKAVCAAKDYNDAVVESDVFPVIIYQKTNTVTIDSDGDTGKHTIDLGLSETTLQLNATVEPASAMPNVTWSSSNVKVATVDSTGLVTAKATGTVTVTATTQDGLAKVATYAVTVGVIAQAVDIEPSNNSLISGGKLALSPQFDPVNVSSKALRWSTSNAKLATVSSSTGLVTAGKVTTAQMVTITAETLDNSGVVATCELWIRPLATKVELYNSDNQLLTGTTVLGINMNNGETDLDLNAVCQPFAQPDEEKPGAAMQNVVWTSANTAVATVTDGHVTAVKDGIAVITATAADGSKKAASVTVKVTCKPEAITLSGATGVAYGKSTYLTASVDPEGVANQLVTWSFESAVDASLASINKATGVITVKNSAANIGKELHVIATTKLVGADGKAVQSDAYTLPIMAPTTSVMTNMGTGNTQISAYLYASQMQLTAICQPVATALQDVVWSSSNTKRATVDQTGLVTFVDAGPVVITAAAKDGSGVKTTVTITISK